MRIIGQLDKETDAQTFSDYLYVRGLHNDIEAGDDGSWDIWVHDEEKLRDACALLENFKNNPSGPEYIEAAALANSYREQQAKTEKAYQKKVYDRKRMFHGRRMRVGVLTACLIAISVILTAYTRLGENLERAFPFLITQFESPLLPEIRAGHVWRLVTPIFLHWGPFHILFNMMWLADLGTMIEKQQGRWRLLAIILLLAIPSNVAQFFVSGPLFGGMSGVIFGLLGYAWMRGRYDPSSGLSVHRHTFSMMMFWFFFCLLGTRAGAMHIANTAHAVGLILGLALGYATGQAAFKSRWEK